MTNTKVIRFSVIIPLYNKAAHIEATLASVLAQTCQDFEVVIVDDGSTDDGPAKVEALARRNVRLISQKNAGVSAARNRGIEAAQGSHVAFLDADDEWLPNHLETLAGLIVDFPGRGLYSTAHANVEGGLIYRKGQPKLVNGRGIIEDFFKSYSHGFSIVNSSTACISRSILKDIGGFPLAANKGEDVLVWINAAMYAGMAYDSRLCVLINKDADNRSTASHRGEVPVYIEWLHERLEASEDFSNIASARPFLAKAVMNNAAGACIANDRVATSKYIKLASSLGVVQRLSVLAMFLLGPKILSVVRVGRRAAISVSARDRMGL